MTTIRKEPRWSERTLKLALLATGIFSDQVCGLHRCRRHQDGHRPLVIRTKIVIIIIIIMTMKVQIAVEKKSQFSIIVNTNLGNGKTSGFRRDLLSQIQKKLNTNTFTSIPLTYKYKYTVACKYKYSLKSNCFQNSGTEDWISPPQDLVARE